MKKNWTLEDIALRSIEVFSKDIAVKQAKQDLEEAYTVWRLDFLGESLHWAKEHRKHLEPGMDEWEAMMGATKDKFETLQDAIKERRNARKRLNHAITQVLTKP
jgi:chromosome segregation ATPase